MDQANFFEEEIPAERVTLLIKGVTQTRVSRGAFRTAKINKNAKIVFESAF